MFGSRALILLCALTALAPSAQGWPLAWPRRSEHNVRGYGSGHPKPGGPGHPGKPPSPPPPTNPDGPAPPAPNCTAPEDLSWKERNFKTISNIYNLTVFPNQLPIISRGGAGVPPGLFNQNVTGRVDPVGDFVGFEDSIEYFFALSPLPLGNPAMAAITKIQITEFSTGCKDVASSVVYLYCSVVNPGAPNHGQPLAPLKQVAFWKFDEEGAVLKYDAWIPNLNSWVQATTAALVTNPLFQAGSIIQVCSESQLRCTGPNKQWESVNECIASLSAKVYGNYDAAWGDNVVCRSIHLVLTQVRPDVSYSLSLSTETVANDGTQIHCPHVGPTGGGKCIDVQYPTDYFSDESLYGEPAGQTFMCPK